MKIIAIKKFRMRHDRQAIAQRGETIDVDQEYGQTLVQTGLAIAASDSKALKEHENKMLAEYEDKKLPTRVETAEQRSQGFSGPGDYAETPEERTQGLERAKAPKKAEVDAEKPTDSPSHGAAKAPEPREQHDIPDVIKPRQKTPEESSKAADKKTDKKSDHKK